MKLRLTCREATALLLAREDRMLPLHERLVLHAHLAACRACPVVARQLLTVRHALEQWRAGNQTVPD